MANSDAGDDREQRRTYALFLAVIHHGFSNLAEGSVPAGWQTVITTAEKFDQYLGGGMPPDDRQGRSR